MSKGLVIGGGIAVLVLALGATQQDRVIEAVNGLVSRGIRNNNPGNIRRSSIPWRGKVPQEDNSDPDFEQFLEPFWGIRAIVRELRTSARRGQNTITEIITEWAPPNENNTDAYIASVSRQIGRAPTEPLDVESNMFGLVTAIIVHENGGNPYPQTTILQGISAA